ncbi:cytochrome P450 [Rhexocercosporidium sp. MPI-PUGE-AT-0058]|nr:cytochrome P450 [Rhexocercosporidium sp. MPI-PUGE-AT-0058]
MANVVRAAFVLASLSLGVYTANHSASTFSYAKTSIFTLIFYIPFHLAWSIFLFPLYFSPLLSLPQAPREGGWKSFFQTRDSRQVLRWMETIPNDGLIRYLDVFNMEVVAVTTPRGAAEFLQVRADQYVKNPKIKRILENLLGNGLVVAEGMDHKYQRKHLLPAFNVKVIKNLYPLFWIKATEMVTLIKQEVETGPKATEKSSASINIDDWAGRVSLDIIGQAGFGSEFSSLSHPNTALNTSYRAAFVPNDNSKLIFVLSLLTTPKLVNLLPGKNNALFREGKRSVTDWVRNLIQERKTDMHNHLDDLDYMEKSGQKDIIAAAMKTKAFSTEDLVHQSKTLLGAGHETSATAVTWGIYILSQPRYAHIQDRLRREIRANLPSPSSGIEVTADMLDKLPYLDAVSKEIMRVYAPVPTVGRVPAQDTDIFGVKIPKGTSVRVHLWAMNKAKQFWGEDAAEFDPERWLVGKDKAMGGATDSLAYLTFGHGPRGCIGRGFAIGENKAILAALVGSFDFKPVPGTDPDDIDVLFGITARIIGGYDVQTTVVEGW